MTFLKSYLKPFGLLLGPWAAAVIIAIIADRPDWWRYSVPMRDAIALFIFLMSVLTLAAYRRFLNSLPIIYGVFFFAFLTVVTACHLINQEFKTHPFLAWTMYASPKAYPAVYYRFLGRDADGKLFDVVNASDLPKKKSSFYFGIQKEALNAFGRKKISAEQKNKAERILKGRLDALRDYYQRTQGTDYETVRVLEVTLHPDGRMGREETKEVASWL